eukprot:5153337-Pleurochrysis_carterae.AAC.1
MIHENIVIISSAEVVTDRTAVTKRISMSTIKPVVGALWCGDTLVLNAHGVKCERPGTLVIISVYRNLMGNGRRFHLRRCRYLAGDGSA